MIKNQSKRWIIQTITGVITLLLVVLLFIIFKLNTTPVGYYVYKQTPTRIYYIYHDENDIWYDYDCYGNYWYSIPNNYNANITNKDILKIRFNTQTYYISQNYEDFYKIVKPMEERFEVHFEKFKENDK